MELTRALKTNARDTEESKEQLEMKEHITNQTNVNKRCVRNPTVTCCGTFV